MTSTPLITTKTERRIDTDVHNVTRTWRTIYLLLTVILYAKS